MLNSLCCIYELYKSYIYPGTGCTKMAALQIFFAMSTDFSKSYIYGRTGCYQDGGVHKGVGSKNATVGMNNSISMLSNMDAVTGNGK